MGRKSKLKSLNDLDQRLTSYGLLIIITLVLVVVGLAVIFCFSTEKASAIGSVVGGFGCVAAFIWFFAALRSQSEQLENQKKQFLIESQSRKEEMRRNALLFARDVLKRAEEKALKQNPKFKTINELSTCYTDAAALIPLKLILESRDPKDILRLFKEWLKTEGPAVTMLRGVKSAAEIYFRATNIKNIDYSKEPEDFVFIYSPHIEKLPYFDAYTLCFSMLAESMIMFQPGRKGVFLAWEIAMAKGTPVSMKEKKIMEKIRTMKAAGNPIPEIAKDFVPNDNPE